MQNHPKGIAIHGRGGHLRVHFGDLGRGAVKCKMPPRELQFTGGDCSRGLEAERKLGRGAVKCKIIQRELQFTAGGGTCAFILGTWGGGL